VTSSSRSSASYAGSLVLLRHGETEWSKSGQHTGLTDIPLTERGEDLARHSASMLKGRRFVAVLTSPLVRARRTAELAGFEGAEVDARLVEWDYGAYEGRTSAEIRETSPDWTIWADGAPGGETPSQVSARADRVLARAVSRMADGPVVLVGHGHFSRALAGRWIGLPVSGGARLLLGTAATSVLGAQYGTPLIVRWNITNPAA
jgi:broad specificity phosphatase PhoE